MLATEVARSCVRSDSVYKAASRLILREPWIGDYTEVEQSPGLSHFVRLPVLKRGKGATVTDVDGNSYIDYFGAAGTLILGHADERVVVAVNKSVSKGCELSSPSEAEVRLAELLAERFTSIDVVRFVGSRTEALIEVSQLAKHYTGRDHIVTFDGLAPAPVTEPRADDWVAIGYNDIDYNDIDGSLELFRRCGSEIAAVVVEPIACSFGLASPQDGFLETLRACCDESGALLIFDESETGFRLAGGGAAELYGVSPDIIVLGTTLGGGMPLAAYGGRSELLRRLTADALASSIASALRGAVRLPAIAAGVALSQATVEPGFYQALETRSARLDEGLRAAASAADVPTHHARVGSMVGMVFSQHPVTDASTARSATSFGAATFAQYHRAMLDRGIFLPPSPLLSLYVLSAHTDEEIERTIEAAHDAFQAIRYSV